ncbi:MAG: putative endonuclease [Frankiales bacterium]|nr:putative endonuclease [Frankiales bacterium]
MAVEALADGPVLRLLAALEEVRSTPAPVGLAAARVALLARASAELRGVYLRDLAQLDPAAEGARNHADLLADLSGLPVAQARKDAALSSRLALLPGLPDAVAHGVVALPAALLLVKAWQALPTRLHDEPLAAALLTLAQLLDLPDLRAKVDELLHALAPDVTDTDLADARDHAHLTLVRVGSRSRLDGECNALTGELLAEILHAQVEAERTDGDTRTTAQRTMAALVSLLTNASSSTPDSPTAPRLVVVATVDDLTRTAETTPDRTDPDDALTELFTGTDLQTGSTTGGEPAAPVRPRWTARTRGGLPVGPRTLAALACRSVLTRLVLSPLGDPLDSSPDARQLDRPGRRALEHRAGYRCERAGCGRPARLCVPHHVVPWALGGPSTQANTVLLCPSCHHLLHDRQRPLELTLDRRIGPRGWLRGGPPDTPGDQRPRRPDAVV